MNSLTEEEKTEVLKKTAIISLSTISLMIKIIEVSSKRGTYSANELTTVGSLYDHLVKGMGQIIEQYKSEKETDTTSTSAEPDQDDEPLEVEVNEE